MVWNTTTNTNVSCNTGTNAVITSTATGGTGTINYNLQPGNLNNTTGSFTGLGNGTYTVSATDANNCSITTTFNITQPTAVTWTATASNNVSCNGGNDGDISVTATGGTGTINYTLQPGNVNNTTGNFAILIAGSYTVTASDANNCTISTIINITQPTPLVINNITSTIPTCVPGSDATITITAGGGTTTYQYNIGGANQASNIFNNVGAGSYTITVTDANNCTLTSVHSVTTPNSPSWTSVTNTNVSCNAGNNGTITSNATGGTGALNYTLQPGAITNTTGNYSTLTAGIYTITVSDANLCTASSTVNITEPTQVVWSVTTSTNVSCNAGNDGAITSTATGGTGAINYNLQPGNINNATGSFASLTFGIYTITATDANNCSITTTFNITQPTAVIWTSTTSNNVSCNGGNDGDISVTATGGTGTINYNLQPGNINNTTGNFTTLISGFYTVTAKDANDCSISTTINITQPTPLVINNITSTIPTCVPGSDATITITAGGGIIVYQYNIGGANQASNVFNNVAAGAYTVAVTDANNCTITSVHNVQVPNSPTWQSFANTNVSCNAGNDATIASAATGGTGALNYTLQPGAVTNATGNFNTLTAGTYTVTVSDANLCTVSSSVIITEPTQVVWNVTTSSNVSCNAGNDGAITSTANGGTGTINYNLQPGNVNNTTGLYPTLIAGGYTVTATDANNCSITTAFTITEPTQVVWTATTSTNVSCNGGNDGDISVTATGGTGTIDYTLQPGNINNTTGNYNGLIAGGYTVTASDANNCTITTAFTITEPTLLVINNITSTIPTCVPGADATITITAAGGTMAYQFNIGGADQASNIFSNNAAGPYTITVTDAQGCTVTSAHTIQTPNSPTWTSVTADSVDCKGGNDGSITSNATGGTGAINYNLMPGNVTNATGQFNTLVANTYTVVATDASGCTVSSSIIVGEPTIVSWSNTAQTNVSCNSGSDATITSVATGGTGAYSYVLQPGNVINTTGLYSGLTAGGYTVTVSDANNCSLTNTFTITEPTQVIWVSATNTNVSCNSGNDGTISVNATGGTGTIDYTLQPGNINNTSGNFNTLIAGTYTVTASDANNCTITSTLIITQPTQLVINNISSTIPSCVPAGDAIITITASGATPTYTYRINAGTYQASNVFNNIAGGPYTITVRDANNCTVTSAHNVQFPVSPTVSNVTATDATCNPGSDAVVTVTATSGTPAYTYSIDGVTFQASNVFNNIAAGTYTVTVSDTKNCTGTSVITVNTTPSPTVGGVVTTNASCVPGCDAQATVTAIPGASNSFTYSIDGTNYQASNVFTNLCTNNYTVTVLDANGCTATSVFIINTANAPVYASVTKTNVLCFGDSSGTISATATSVNNPIAYVITPNIGTQPTPGNFNGLPVGNYTIVATDAFGCTVQTNVTLTEPSLLQIPYVNVTNAIIFNTPTGHLGIGSSGGTPPCSYAINPTGGTFTPPDSFANLFAGIYTITLTDANGCTSTSVATIIEPDPITWDTISTTNNLCFGDSSGTIFVGAIGGLGPITYSITPNMGGQSPTGQFFGLAAGTYTILANDSVGAWHDTILTLTQPVPIVVNNVVRTIPTCIPGNDATMSVTASGGVGILTYSISPSAGNAPNTTGNFVGLTDINYTISITDTNNCQYDTVIAIDPPFTPVIVIDSITNVDCYGNSTGIIYTTASSQNAAIITQSITPLIGFQPFPGTYAGLPAGNYVITVTDAAGCDLSTNVTVTEPPLLVLDSVTKKDITCFGAADGEIDVYANGGTTPYEYSINNGINYAPNQLFTNLGNGIYTVVVKDANNCTTSSTIEIIEPPANIIDSILTKNITCFGGNDGEIDVYNSGGIAPHTYKLMPNNATNGTGDFLGLFAGVYTVTVADANNCTVTSSVTLTQPPPLVINTVNVLNVICFGDSTGSITINVTGGTGTITYDISPQTGQQTVPGYFSNLYSTTYTITATDANNCSITSAVFVDQNPTLSFDSINIKRVRCFGESNATINVEASGGVGSIVYQLNGGPYLPVGSWGNLSAGFYTITLTDVLSCTKDTVLEVTEPDKLIIDDVDITEITCADTKDGKIIATATGGNGTNTFYMRPGIRINRSGVFGSLSRGEYVIRVRDTLGCEYDTTVIMGDPNNLMRTTIKRKDLTCVGYGNEGEAEVLPEGGLPPYTYLWSTTPAQNTQKATGLGYGFLFVEVIDANGCLVTDTTYIQPGPCCQEVFLPNAFSPNNDGRNDTYGVSTAAGVELIQFEIFNRWGQRVWTTTDFRGRWNGTYRGEPMPVDTYYYVFHYKCNTDGKKYIKKGDVIIVR